jgi:hypothetical protein
MMSLTLVMYCSIVMVSFLIPTISNIKLQDQGLDWYQSLNAVHK